MYKADKDAEDLLNKCLLFFFFFLINICVNKYFEHLVTQIV